MYVYLPDQWYRDWVSNKASDRSGNSSPRLIPLRPAEKETYRPDKQSNKHKRKKKRNITSIPHNVYMYIKHVYNIQWIYKAEEKITSILYLETQFFSIY